MRAPVVLPADASHEQWLAARTHGIGGSDVSAAVGLNPWKTPYQLWLEKTGRDEPLFEPDARERMRWGHILEPVLLDQWDRNHPEYVLTGGAGIYAHPDRLWHIASVDGLGWRPDGTLERVVEAKTGTARAARDWDDDAVPVHYVTQVQWYMSVLDAPAASMCALLDTSTYVERTVERDDDLIADLVECAAEFWQWVHDDTPPPMDGTVNTRRALSRATAHAGETIELDPLWRKAITERQELSDGIADLTRRRNLIDNELRAAMGTAEVALLDGDRVASHKAGTKPVRTADLDALAADPDAYAAYVTEKAPTRRLTYRKVTTDE